MYTSDYFDDTKQKTPDSALVKGQCSALVKGSRVLLFGFKNGNYKLLNGAKKMIIDFIDEHADKLASDDYDCVIVHILTHGSEDDRFTTHDLKQMKSSEFIEHELGSSCADPDMVKLIFHHACRGEADYSDFVQTEIRNRTGPKHAAAGEAKQDVEEEEKKEVTVPWAHKKTMATKGHYVSVCQDSTEIEMVISSGLHSLTRGTQSQSDNQNSNGLSGDANWVTIYGTKSGNTMSDLGPFTDCICDAFKANACRRKKKNFRDLVTEIGTNLKKKTNGAQMADDKGGIGRLNHVQLRLEKQKNKPAGNESNDNEETKPLKGDDIIH
eukprot:619825_1